ncbi:MAG TPA: MtrB/PioB family outer membrane beta-barrel protein [Vicinamibacteria bacterium]
MVTKRAIVLGIVLLAAGAQAQEPAGETFQFGEIHLGVMQTDSNTLSSKFMEYREVPDGVVVPAFRLKGAHGGVWYEAFGGNVQQTDQYYGLRLGKESFRVEGLYNRIPHNFGNAGHTLLERTGEGVWVLSDTLQRSFQNTLTTQFDCTGLTTAQCTAKRNQINFTFLNNLVTPSLTAANSVDLRLERERGQLSLRLTPKGPVDVRLSYFRERRVGDRAASGTSFGFGNVVELPEPLHYLTQDFGADAEYEARWGLLRAGLHVNRFENRLETLAFDNPFRITDSTDASAYQAPGSASVAGPVFGLMALPPDNEAITGTVGATFKLPSRTRLSANVSVGRWTQDKSPFIPYTTNTSVLGEDNAGGTFPATDPSRLPARQLDGKMDVTSLSFNLSSRPTPELSFTARFRNYDLGNDTPRLQFPGYVRFDGVWEEIPRISVPYAYRNRRLDASVAYDFGQVSLEGGFRHTSMARHFRETEDTSENAVSVAADLRAAGWAVLRASYERAKRDFEGLEIELSEEASFQVPGAPANLLAVEPSTVCPAGRVCNLRFDQAKKDVDRIGANLQLTPWGNTTVALGYLRTKDDYTETTFGLVSAQYDTLSAEVDYAPSAKVNLFGYFTHEKIADFQRGRQSGGTVSTNPLDDWTSNVDDKADSFGGGANFVLRPDKWFLDLSGRYQKVNGNNDLSSPTGGAPFAARTAIGGVQDLPFYDDTKITTLQAELRYQFAKSWSATVGGWFEDYEIRDSNTQELLNYVPGSFFLAAQDGDYQAKVGYFRLSYRW